MRPKIFDTKPLSKAQDRLAELIRYNDELGRNHDHPLVRDTEHSFEIILNPRRRIGNISSGRAYPDGFEIHTTTRDAHGATRETLEVFVYPAVLAVYTCSYKSK